ncbi:MAG: abortive infection family protein [Armatimonadota bacterium]
MSATDVDTVTTGQGAKTSSIECHYQRIGMGSLICGAAQSSRGDTNEVTRDICEKCIVGRVYREVGCDVLSPKIGFHHVSSGILTNLRGLFCQKRMEEITDDETCFSCNLVSADTTKQLTETVKGLFQQYKFYTAYHDLQSITKSLRDGDLAHVVTLSSTCFESTMKACHERLNMPLPKDKSVTGLWKSTREILAFDEVCVETAHTELLNVLCGVVGKLGELRNALGSAHGRGEQVNPPPELIAELALNTAMTLITATVRRYGQIEEKNHE